MKKNNMILYSAILLACCTITLSLHAQPNKPWQLQPHIGLSHTLLNKNIYPDKPVNIGQQFGLGLQYALRNHLAFKLEVQYRQFSLQKNITATYGNLIGNDPSAIRSFQPSSIVNGLLGMQYSLLSKNGRNQLELGLGGGIQRLTQGQNMVAFSNPYLLGNMDTVYQSSGQSLAPVAQLGIQNTYYIRCNFGITLGVNVQYAPALYDVSYTRVTADNGSPISFQDFCKATNIVQTAYAPLNFSFVAGIHIAFRRCPPKDDGYPLPKSCFNLLWRNPAPKDSCFRGDKITCAIVNSAFSPSITGYDISIAPLNNLNQQQFLFSLPYPSLSFNISSALLEANKQYVVIVQLKSNKKTEECVQYINPVKRCADACKDAKLPGKQ